MRHTRMILSPMPQREILGRIRMQADVDSEIHDLCSHSLNICVSGLCDKHHDKRHFGAEQKVANGASTDIEWGTDR